MTKRLPPVEEQRRRTNRNRRRDREQVKAAYRDAAKTIADQAIVHRRETTTLAANYVAMKDALAAAVKRFDWLLANGYAPVVTPADRAELEEWRKRASD